MRLCGLPRLTPSVANRFAALSGWSVVHKAFWGPPAQLQRLITAARVWISLVYSEVRHGSAGETGNGRQIRAAHWPRSMPPICKPCPQVLLFGALERGP